MVSLACYKICFRPTATVLFFFISRSPFLCALSTSIIGSVTHPAGDRPSHPNLVCRKTDKVPPYQNQLFGDLCVNHLTHFDKTLVAAFPSLIAPGVPQTETKSTPGDGQLRGAFPFFDRRRDMRQPVLGPGKLQGLLEKSDNRQSHDAVLFLKAD